MPKPFDKQFALVASGFSTADFVTKRGMTYGLLVPTVDSCAATLRGSWDQTSANYLAIQNAVGSADWTLSVSTGSKAFVLADVHGMVPFPFVRVLLGVIQTQPRTLTLVDKSYFPA
jgi:hypothetical protein